MSDSNGTSNGNGTAAPASNGSPEQLKVEEKKGGVKYDVILDHAKSPARPQARYDDFPEQKRVFYVLRIFPPCFVSNVAVKIVEKHE